METSTQKTVINWQGSPQYVAIHNSNYSTQCIGEVRSLINAYKESGLEDTLDLWEFWHEEWSMRERANFDLFRFDNVLDLDRKHQLKPEEIRQEAKRQRDMSHLNHNWMTFKTAFTKGFEFARKNKQRLF